MKRFLTLILILAAACASSCSGSAERHISDFSTEVYTPIYASKFDIRGTRKDASTLITVHSPWQGAANLDQHLILLRGKAKAPRNTDVQAVRAPVRRVVCMSSSHVALFDAIGQAPRIVGVSGIEYIHNPIIRERSLCGEVRDVGYDSNLDFELLTALNPDLILLYGVIATLIGIVITAESGSVESIWNEVADDSGLYFGLTMAQTETALLFTGVFLLLSGLCAIVSGYLANKMVQYRLCLILCVLACVLPLFMAIGLVNMIIWGIILLLIGAAMAYRIYSCADGFSS